MNVQIRHHLLLLAVAALLVVFAACDGDEGSQGPEDDARDSSDVGDGLPENAIRLNCPAPGELPFQTESTGFQLRSNEALLAQPAKRHHSLDVLVNPGDDQVLTGAVVTGRIVFPATPSFIEGEFVSAWTYRGGTWEQLGRAKTGAGGEFTIDIADEDEFTEGTHVVYTIIEADQSCFTQLVAVWPEGTRFVIADIDGTLTSSDGEFTTQINDQSYDPKEHPGASEMMNAWFDKGYQDVYLTARPHDARVITRQWLFEHDYPLGPLSTAEEFGFGSATATYKTEFTSQLIDDLGWEFIAGYGNSDTDFQGYIGAGAPVSRMFAIEGAKGFEGTTAITGDDYRPHTADYVASQPDNADPIDNR